MMRRIGAVDASGRTNFSYAWETRVPTGWIVEPGFQAYGEPGSVGRLAPISQQDHRAGPMLFGAVHDIGPGR